MLPSLRWGRARAGPGHVKGQCHLRGLRHGRTQRAVGLPSHGVGSPDYRAAV